MVNVIYFIAGYIIGFIVGVTLLLMTIKNKEL